MKHMKNIWYIIRILFSIGMVLILSTAIVQFGTEAITKSLGISMKADFLSTISGGLGTAITGTICAAYAKKKNYTNYIEVREPFRIKTCAYYCAAAFFICSVLYDAITTFLFVNVFSMTDEIHVAAEKNWADILLMDIFFPILIAPVFEELLFRMGLYSMMRRRFEKNFSILLCTITFAVIHGYSIQGFFMCLIGGLLFMLIYVRTGNIGYSIAAHMICNLSANILNALEDNGITFLGIPIQYEVAGFNMIHPVLIITAIVFCGICIIKKVKNSEK